MDKEELYREKIKTVQDYLYYIKSLGKDFLIENSSDVEKLDEKTYNYYELLLEYVEHVLVNSISAIPNLNDSRIEEFINNLEEVCIPISKNLYDSFLLKPNSIKTLSDYKSEARKRKINNALK